MLRWVCCILLLLSAVPAPASDRELRVMVIFAHPDEGEIYAGGTSILYTRLGHKVKFLSLTNGDAGHFSMEPQALARRRFGEAMEAKRILGLSEYEVLDYHDGKLKNTEEIRVKVAKNIENWKADIVFTYYPVVGGHNDNMNAGWIVRDAAALLNQQRAPAFLYMRDYFTSDFSYIPDIAVPIDEVWETKLRGCGAHESQVLEYNPNLMGVLKEVQASKENQREFLFNNTYAFSRITPDNALSLRKWYGEERTARVRYVEAFEIAEFGRQLNQAAIRELLPMLDVPFTLPGTANWMDIGIDVTTGQYLEITSEGRVVWKKESMAACGPTGAVPYTRWGKKPIPGVGTGALIGKIGRDALDYFYIGANQQMEVYASGRLFLGINDDNVSDNDGAFRVWVQRLKSH
jgi:LmbE family N-acetylglucosaminyl deacetylase